MKTMKVLKELKSDTERVYNEVKALVHKHKDIEWFTEETTMQERLTMLEYRRMLTHVEGALALLEKAQA